MSYGRSQCLICFATEAGKTGPTGGIELRFAADRATTSATAATTRVIDAFALLPEIFCQDHPDVIKKFHASDIIVIRNEDEFTVAEGHELNVLEVFLDESPIAESDRRLFLTATHIDSSILPLTLMFRQTTAKLGRATVEATPTRSAVDERNCDVFKRLASHRLSIPGKDNSPVECRLLHVATVREQEFLARVALDYGADVDATTTEDVTALHLAVASGALSLVKLFVASGATLDRKDDVGYTPLHVATLKHAEVVEFLLRSGADVNAVTVHGSTPLHLAAESNACALVQLLVDWGAAVGVKDEDGRTALHYAKTLQTLEILLEGGADANSSDDLEKTPLFEAIGRGCMDSRKLLLDYGASVDHKCDGLSIVGVAYQRQFCSVELFKYLLERCFLDQKLLEDTQVYQILSHNSPNFKPYLYSRDRFDAWSQVFAGHLVKIKALKPQTSGGHSVHCYWREGNVAQFQERCEMEIAKMKSRRVAETDLSVFDILAKDEFEVALLVRNSSVARFVEPDRVEEQFPIYGSIFTIHVEVGKHRNSSMNRTVQACNASDFYFRMIPDEIKEVIFDLLCTLDIVNVRRACLRYAVVTCS